MSITGQVLNLITEHNILRFKNDLNIKYYQADKKIQDQKITIDFVKC